MDTSEIRKLFLDYFKNQGHTVVPSSSLVPTDDPSLLFTSAGMVQFKKVFLGQEVLEYKRAVSCQRCLRAGGKHNDLENVGFTSRHHTFFEMLGNFSFGDYFKREAIFYAWEFITKYLKIPAEKLWITVYKDDSESADIWLKDIKIDPSRFSKCDADENFWSMGDTGPCGPCTEIYYDHGSEFVGSAPGFGDTNERYVEIYNLVFMQYNRSANGELHNLPKPCVDTGMGLERVAAIMQSVHNNYRIDIFIKLIKDIGELLNVYDLNNTSLRVIADHLRACAFLVTDGVVPTNEGRGYVLRRIMRRAIRHGYKLGRQQPFFHLLVKSVAKVMGNDFTALKEYKSKIEKIFLTEELQFAKTLEHGMKLLQQEIKNTTNGIINGEIVFKLYDTYGFPVDLTMDVAREHAMTLDIIGFDKCMLEQKTRARQLTKFKDMDIDLDGLTETKFVGYEQNEIQTKIVQIFLADNNQHVNELTAGQVGKIILEATPFYAQSGGQVGDAGFLLSHNGAKFIIADTHKLAKTNIHIGQLETGVLAIGDIVDAKIDIARRQKIRLNHSATHLLHAALRIVLGTHVKQKGSVVDDKRLRFDFEHFQPLTTEQIAVVELLVNEKIRANIPTKTEIMSTKDAINIGAIALFDEKYQDKVRVLNIVDGFSVELCGGTHVVRSGDIGCFKILTEEAIASGTRRIEAITGEQVVKYISDSQNVLNNTLKLLKIPHQDSIHQNINKLLHKTKELEKNLEMIEKKNALMQIEKLQSKAEVVANGVKILVINVDVNPRYLKLAIDQLKQSLTTAVIILGCEYNSKAIVIVGVTKNLLIENNLTKNKISALDLIKHVAVVIDGKGGGRDDLSEASGNNVKNLSVALEVGYKKIMEYIANI